MKQRQPALYGVYEMLKAEEKDLVLKGIHSKKGLFHISWNSSIIEELGQMLQSRRDFTIVDAGGFHYAISGQIKTEDF